MSEYPLEKILVSEIWVGVDGSPAGEKLQEDDAVSVNVGLL